jgi:hypothetical protein
MGEGEGEAAAAAAAAAVAAAAIAATTIAAKIRSEYLASGGGFFWLVDTRPPNVNKPISRA